MSNSSMFFENFKNQILLSINTCMPCQILSYDEKKLRAKIQPLFKAKEIGHDPEALPVIEDVPVVFERVKIHRLEEIKVSIPEGEHKHDGGGHAQYTGSGVHSHDGGEHEHKKLTFKEEVVNIPVYKKGDIVLVVFAQRAIDEAVEGNMVYPGSARYLDLQDAIIVGLLKEG